MHNYGIPVESMYLELTLGILVSVIIYQRWHVMGGAAVVAGYLGIFIDRPLYILVTIVLAVVTLFIINRIIAPRIFLYSRTRLVVMIMIGLVLQLLTGLIAYKMHFQAPWLAGLFGVGFVLPGLITQDMERQGILKTILAVVITSTITFLLFHGFIFLKTFFPIQFTTPILGINDIQYSYNLRFLIPAVVLSIITSVVLYQITGIYSGGFVTAGYLSLFILKPLHIVFVLIIGLLVYFFVTRILMRYIPIFGRTKFAMTILTSLVFTMLATLVIVQLSHGSFAPFTGFTVISPMIAGLIANDSERQGLPKTIVGVLICTAFVFCIIKGIDLLFVQ